MRGQNGLWRVKRKTLANELYTNYRLEVVFERSFDAWHGSLKVVGAKAHGRRQRKRDLDLFVISSLILPYFE